MGTNDITGDKLRSKIGNTQAYNDGYDAIFGNKTKTKKLYDLKRADSFLIVKAEEEGEFVFDHIDGAYSVCYNDKNEMVHVAAWTEVTPVDKG